MSQVRDLKPDGRNIVVTEENKYEYMKLVCQMKMTGAIKQQLTAFLEGFYDIVPKKLISIFNEQELELLISGLPTIDIDDLKTNTEYHKYQPTSLQVNCLVYSSTLSHNRTRLLVHNNAFSPCPLAALVDQQNPSLSFPYDSFHLFFCPSSFALNCAL